jgi:hypothetical protein
MCFHERRPRMLFTFDSDKPNRSVWLGRSCLNMPSIREEKADGTAQAGGVR